MILLQISNKNGQEGITWGSERVRQHTNEE
jgi:hypothetical protein